MSIGQTPVVRRDLVPMCVACGKYVEGPDDFIGPVLASVSGEPTMVCPKCGERWNKPLGMVVAELMERVKKLEEA